MNLGNIVLIVAMIFVVCAAGAAAVTIYLVVRKSNDSPSPFHQNVVLVAFSIFVTAIVVLLGLVTLGTDPPSSLKGQIGLITFNLAGPPAVWIVVFMVTGRRFDLKSVANSNGAFLVPSIDFEGHYKMLGFDYYRNWKPALNQFRQIIDDSELTFIEDLLPKVFYHGPFDALKPEDVITTTLFVFSKGKAVKFQRIQGKVKTEGQRRSQVYLSQTSSTPNGEIACLHFIRSEERIRQTACHGYGEWKVAPFDNIDIMLLAIYENDDVENGDYVYVDVSKYIDLTRMEGATVEIAIAADRQMDEFCIWEVSASLASTERPVPLMFRRLENETPKRSVSDVEKNSHRIAELFDGWDSTLDQAFAGSLGQRNKITPDEVRNFLGKVKGILAVYEPNPEVKSFRELFHSLRPADCVINTLKHQRNVILTTFTWA